jgi:hypothetical protein
MADSERLEQLVAKLTPLAQMQRGRVIRAQDWNDIVVALLDVVRVVFGIADTDETVPAHTHPDQVTEGWLAETLRQRILQGAQPLADRLAAVERSLRALATEVEGSVRGDDDLRGRLLAVEGRELALGKDLGGLRTVVDGVRQNQSDVSDLRLALGRIEPRVMAASTLAERLEIAGQPSDLDTLDTRLKAVETLNTRMRTPTGELLDASAIEARLAAAESRYATKAELSDVAARRTAGLTDAERAALEDRIRTTLTATVDTRVSESEARLRASSEAALATVDARIDARVASAGGELRDSILSAAAADAAQRVAAATDATLATITTRFADVERTFDALLKTKITEVLTRVNTVATEIARKEIEVTAKQLRAEINELRTRAPGRPGRGGTDR